MNRTRSSVFISLIVSFVVLVVDVVIWIANKWISVCAQSFHHFYLCNSIWFWYKIVYLSSSNSLIFVSFFLHFLLRCVRLIKMGRIPPSHHAHHSTQWTVTLNFIVSIWTLKTRVHTHSHSHTYKREYIIRAFRFECKANS